MILVYFFVAMYQRVVRAYLVYILILHSACCALSLDEPTKELLMGHYNAKRKRFDYYVVVCRDIGQVVVTSPSVRVEVSHESVKY